MRIARANPSRGTSSRSCRRSVPVKRMVFHEITKEAVEWAAREPSRARPTVGRCTGGAPDPRPAVRLRGLARAVAQGAPSSVGGPRAERCNADHRRNESASAWRSVRRPTGTSKACSKQIRPGTNQPRSTRRSLSLDGARLATGKDFDRQRQAEACRRRRARRGGARGAGRGTRRGRVLGHFGRGEAVQAVARTRRSSRRRCSRKPVASSASRRSARCRLPSASTRTVTSPI